MAKKQSVVTAAAESKINKTVDQENPVSTETIDQAAEVETREAIKAEDAYKITTEQIDLALSEGHVRWAGGIPRGEKQTDGDRTTALTDVTITKDKSPTKKEEVIQYEKLEAISDVGQILLSGGKLEAAVLRGDEKVDPRTEQEKLKGACDHFNYGRDLNIKRELRKMLLKQIAGPEKAIKNMAKAFLELKMAKNMEQAMIKARKEYEAGLAEMDADEDTDDESEA
jgi:hypothetical protein